MKKYILLLLIFAIPVSFPLLHSGFFHFSDEPHIANLYEMVRAIQIGQFPPRWVPDMSWGYGYPLFNFYYPFPFYLGAVFFSFTDSLVQSLKLVFLISVFISPIGMFLWLRKHTNNINAFVGAVIYLYTPYRAVDLYVRGALGECVAFAIIPFIFLTIYNVVHQKKSRDIALLGVSVAILILSHNLAPLLFLPIAAMYSIVLIYQRKNYKLFIPVVLGLILGLAMSGYFWIPALLEKSLLVSETPFNYVDHFPFIKQLIYSPFKYGASVWGPHDDISFQIGLANLLLVALSFMVIIKRKQKNEKVLWGFLFLVFISALFLMNIRSSFLWELFSLSTYIQFPWRFLMVTTFITSSFVIFMNARLALLLGAFAIISTGLYFQPSEYFYPDDNYFLNRFFANRNVSGEIQSISDSYKTYSEDYLLLPKWIEKRPTEFVFARVATGYIQLNNVEKVSDISYKIELGAAFDSEEPSVDIYHYYFPGWVAESNGKNLDISITGEDGHMRIENPPANSTIKVYWKETPLRKAADAISLLGVGYAILLLIPWKLKLKKYV